MSEEQKERTRREADDRLVNGLKQAAWNDGDDGRHKVSPEWYVTISALRGRLAQLRYYETAHRDLQRRNTELLERARKAESRLDAMRPDARQRYRESGAPHPGYGPCDAIATGAACSECTRQRQEAEAKRDEADNEVTALTSEVKSLRLEKDRARATVTALAKERDEAEERARQAEAERDDLTDPCLLENLERWDILPGGTYEPEFRRRMLRLGANLKRLTRQSDDAHEALDEAGYSRTAPASMDPDCGELETLSLADRVRNVLYDLDETRCDMVAARNGYEDEHSQHMQCREELTHAKLALSGRTVSCGACERHVRERDAARVNLGVSNAFLRAIMGTLTDAGLAVGDSSTLPGLVEELVRQRDGRTRAMNHNASLYHKAGRRLEQVASLLSWAADDIDADDPVALAREVCRVVDRERGVLNEALDELQRLQDDEQQAEAELPEAVQSWRKHRPGREATMAALRESVSDDEVGGPLYERAFASLEWLATAPARTVATIVAAGDNDAALLKRIRKADLWEWGEAHEAWKRARIVGPGAEPATIVSSTDGEADTLRKAAHDITSGGTWSPTTVAEALKNATILAPGESVEPGATIVAADDSDGRALEAMQLRWSEQRGVYPLPAEECALRRATILAPGDTVEAQCESSRRDGCRVRIESAKEQRERLGWEPLSEEQERANLEHNLGGMARAMAAHHATPSDAVQPDRPDPGALCDFEDCDQCGSWTSPGGLRFCRYHAADSAMMGLSEDDRRHVVAGYPNTFKPAPVSDELRERVAPVVYEWGRVDHDPPWEDVPALHREHFYMTADAVIEALQHAGALREAPGGPTEGEWRCHYGPPEDSVRVWYDTHDSVSCARVGIRDCSAYLPPDACDEMADVLRACAAAKRAEGGE